MKFFAIIVIVTLSGVSVCSAQFTAPAQPKAAPKIGVQPPGPGSYFRIKHWYTYADNSPDGPNFATRFVMERGTSFEDKHNVLVGELQNDQRLSRFMVNYDSNGDIEDYVGRDCPGAPNGWERIPLGSRDTVVCVKDDRTYGGMHHIIVDTLSFLEAKDTTIEGILWHAIKIRHIVSLEGHIYNDEVDWYDAESGFVIHMEFPPRKGYRRDLPTNGEEVHVFDYKINP